MISSIAVQVLPMTANENDVIKIVDHVIAYIDASGVNYQVGAQYSFGLLVGLFITRLISSAIFAGVIVYLR
ncbi:hypothetical protein BMS84_06910 [Leuconostoc pseudomesenteroides]|nr:hypothetical protein BMS84_06910 [Leuconostoc pseudomesenteroides]